ncbi:MAG: metallophosphoesterase family protein [Chitinophagaceae bacterium]|nr:metallophosphoesterase family protein [Chitinophagaceae bacterium]
MTSIGLLSDTHGTLIPEIFHHFKDVDEIWHAGDIGNLEVADQLETFKPFRAVYGNIDGAELRVRYPEHLHFTLEQTAVYMTHIGGYPPKYNIQSKEQIAIHHPHLFICGHSHILKVMPDPVFNLLHVNPGACGKQGWHKVNTLIRFVVNGDHLEKLEVIEIKK